MKFYGRKQIAFLLVFLMCFGLFPAKSFAEETVEDIPSAEELFTEEPQADQESADDPVEDVFPDMDTGEDDEPEAELSDEEEAEENPDDGAADDEEPDVTDDFEEDDEYEEGNEEPEPENEWEDDPSTEPEDEPGREDEPDMEEEPDLEVDLTDSSDEALDEISEESVSDEELIAQNDISEQSENTEENNPAVQPYDQTVITGFADLEICEITERHKPALEALLMQLPEAIVAYLGGMPADPETENADVPPEGSVQETVFVNWACVQDYNEWQDVYEFQPVLEGYAVADGVDLPTVTVMIEDLDIPVCDYVESGTEDTVPIVGSYSDRRYAAVRYDAREAGILPPVRDQDPYGTCWAFAAIGAVEADLVADGRASADSVDLSELHLVYFAKHEYADPKNLNTGDAVASEVSSNYLGYYSGGNCYFAYQTMANMVGPVDESSAPYYSAASYAPGGDAAKSMNEVQITGVYLMNPNDTDAIKSGIMEHGAVSASMYVVPNYSLLRYYYSSENNCYYYPNGGGTNHAVMLVGWDDTFPSENFPEENRPEGDGAWLVRNSWGYEGDSFYGYFWISYYDRGFLSSLAVATYDAETSLYDHIYAYDTAVGSCSYYYMVDADNSVVQTFTVDAGESVEAVGINLGADNDVTVSVTDGINTAEGHCSTNYRGYYLIPLTSAFTTAKQTPVTVTVTYNRWGSVYFELTGWSGYYYGSCGSGGFTFLGPDGSESKVNFDASIKLITNDSFAAVYGLSFDAAGGDDVPSQTVAAGNSFAVPDTSRNGFVLRGWNVMRSDRTWYVSSDQAWMTEAEISQKNCSKAFFPAGQICRLDDSWTGGSADVSFTFHAVWKEAYTVSYDANGGSGAPPVQMKIQGADLTLSTAVPTRNGYNFLGWSEDSAAVTAAYQPGGRYASDKSVTLYAVWKVIIYTVSYNATGGSGAPEAQTKLQGTALTLSSVVPTRSGFIFAGWSESSSASSIQYQPGAQYTQDRSIILYAVWNAAPRAADPLDPVEEYVRRCYRLILGREGEAAGVESWTSALKSGQRSGAEIVSGFINSQEFLSQQRTNELVVIILYRTMLGREPDDTGKAAWVSALNAGSGYDYIINGFSDSQEFGGICAEYGIRPGRGTVTQSQDRGPQVTAFVSRCYLYALNRQAEQEGLNNWTNTILNKAQTPQQVAHGFVFSQECINRNLNNRAFVEMLYRLYMGREPDEPGLNNWKSALDSGTSREKVVQNFSQSQEFRSIVAGYGL